jgi:hypothetical protein
MHSTPEGSLRRAVGSGTRSRSRTLFNGHRATLITIGIPCGRIGRPGVIPFGADTYDSTWVAREPHPILSRDCRKTRRR